MMPPTSPRTPPHFPVPDIGSNVRTDAARALVSFVTMMALVVMAGLFTLATASAQNYVTNVNYEYFVPVTNGGSAPIWSISAGTVYTVQLTNGPTNPVGPTTTIYNNTTNASLNWISTAENSDTNYYPATVKKVTNGASKFGTYTTNYATLTNTYFWDTNNGSNNIAVFTNAYTKYIANPATSNQETYVCANGLVNATTNAAAVIFQGGNPLTLQQYSADGVNFVIPSISSTYGGPIQFQNTWLMGSNGVNFSSVTNSTNKALGVVSFSSTSISSLSGNVTSQNATMRFGATNNFAKISVWDIISGVLDFVAGNASPLPVMLGGKIIFGAGQVDSYYGTSTNTIYATANSGTNTDNMSYVATNSGTLIDTWVGNPAGTGTNMGTGVNFLGNGGFAMAGTGNFVLTGSNGFGGVGITNTVNTGMLTASNSSALGNTNNALDVQSGTLNLSIYTTASQEGYDVTNYYGAATNFHVNNIGTISANANVYQMGGVSIGNGTITSLGGGTAGTLISTGFTATNDGSAWIGVNLDDAGTVAPFTQNGTGTTTLSGNNTFTGATTINSGTLIINGTNKVSLVNAYGGTLAGTGSVGPVNSSGATIAPGVDANTPGVLTISALTNSPGSGSSITMKANGTGGPGVTGGYDQIVIDGGTFQAADNLILNLNGLSSSASASLQLFSYTNGAVWDPAFNFITIQPTGLVPGSLTYVNSSWTWFWLSTDPGAIQNNATLNMKTGILILDAVPEPSSWVLLSLAAIGLLVVSRRRKA